MAKVRKREDSVQSILDFLKQGSDLPKEDEEEDEDLESLFGSSHPPTRVTGVY